MMAVLNAMGLNEGCRFVDALTIEVNGKPLGQAYRVATGAHPFIPSVPGAGWRNF